MVDAFLGFAVSVSYVISEGFNGEKAYIKPEVNTFFLGISTSSNT
ncbi:MAG: hypothetical protein ACFFDE_07575 [Promethearchaeota archaeon]